MKAAKMVFNQIYQLTSDLVGTALCNDQNFPIQKGLSWDDCQIEIPSINVSAALKHKPYQELFYELDRARSFNLKLLDGALIQLQYKFKDDLLVGHRLAFFPNPDLASFQENPDDYLDDEIYLDITDPRVVVTPLRFDYDNREDVVKDVEHPMSHLTIGQYQNCRIPVVRSLTPSQFITFIVRNFYHTAYNKYCSQLTPYEDLFELTITEEERKIIHMGIY